MYVQIESLENKKVKEWAKLSQKKYRDEMSLFIVEGKNLVTEAYQAGVLEELILEKGKILPIDVDTYFVTPEIIRKITTLDTPCSVLGVCRKKEEKEIGNKILILDDISDPGNLGTIIRSACAFSVDTIILSKNTVDLYNPKVVRATQGMLFNINIIYKDLSNYIPLLKANGYKIYGTDVNGGVNVKSLKEYGKICVIIGNEGKGVSDNIKKLCDKHIYINMNEKCESLNVGVAASIILYELDN